MIVKRILSALLAFVMLFSLAGCDITAVLDSLLPTETPPSEEESTPKEPEKEEVKEEPPAETEPAYSVNYIFTGDDETELSKFVSKTYRLTEQNPDTKAYSTDELTPTVAYLSKYGGRNGIAVIKSRNVQLDPNIITATPIKNWGAFVYLSLPQTLQTAIIADLEKESFVLNIVFRVEVPNSYQTEFNVQMGSMKSESCALDTWIELALPREELTDWYKGGKVQTEKLQKIFSGESSFSNLVEAWGGSKSDAYIYIDEISWKTEVEE